MKPPNNEKSCLWCERASTTYPLCAECLIAIRDLNKQHNPEHQDTPYDDRCDLCSYTRHPCDMFDMTSIVISMANTMLINMPSFEPLWNNSETATFLGVSQETLKTFRDSHQLPYIRPKGKGAVRYNPVSVREWVTGRESLVNS